MLNFGGLVLGSKSRQAVKTEEKRIYKIRWLRIPTRPTNFTDKFAFFCEVQTICIGGSSYQD